MMPRAYACPPERSTLKLLPEAPPAGPAVTELPSAPSERTALGDTVSKLASTTVPLVGGGTVLKASIADTAA